MVMPCSLLLTMAANRPLLPVVCRNSYWLLTRSLHSTSRSFCSPVASEVPGFISNDDIRKFRSRMFTEEQQRQTDAIARLEKIEVNVLPYRSRESLLGTEEAQPITMILNKGLSTPYHAAKHTNLNIVDAAALAMVNNKVWDMNRPLKDDCTIEFLTFHSENPYHANRAFWRSCSFLLGAVIDTVFKEEHQVELHSFLPPRVSSGSFTYDADLKFSDWKPTKRDLMVFSAAIHRMAEKSLPFERLQVSQEFATELFQHNKYKLSQIPGISEVNEKYGLGSDITVYRVGDHVDISRGPMVGNTSFIGRRCTIAAAHQVEHDGRPMYRFQGVALPKGVNLNHFAFGILEKRAAQLNDGT